MTGSRSPAARLRPHLGPAVPGLIAVGLMLVWAVHDGGYDEDTWYWGALAMLALTAGALVRYGPCTLARSRTLLAAISLFTAYTAWSYASIAWAQDRGAALAGSNKTLLYLLTFTLMAVLPWTVEAAFAALLAFAVGIGVTAVVLLWRLAAGNDVSVLFVSGRLAAPTGYINSTAALFTMGALVAIAVAARRELWGPVRGLLVAFAAAELDLALTVESRGWLFTLPLVALVAMVIVPNRLRVTAAAALVVVAAALPARRLLAVYSVKTSDPLAHLARHAGQPALVLCFVAFVVGTLLAWIDSVVAARGHAIGRRGARAIGTVLAICAIAGVVGVGEIVSKGDPGHFVVRQWNALVHSRATFGSSHFADVGSGRFDFWRVALKAFEAHPVGGLGQDNFTDYYLLHRRTGEEPQWTHSLEMRLLAHTGAVGFALFAGFVVLALGSARRARRRRHGQGPDDAGRTDLRRGVAAASMLPVVVWLIHGSVDWFWEMPALSGPALGFLAMAGSLSATRNPARAPAPARPVPAHAAAPARARLARRLVTTLGGAAALAALVVLAFPYLSVREVSIGTDAQNLAPAASLHDLRIAGRLNPLDSTPGLVAGAVALRHREWRQAQRSFEQSLDRAPGGWLAWLGAGLAASEQGHRALARSDYVRAHRIDRTQPAVVQALDRIDTRHPVSSAQALRLLVPVG